MPLAAGSSTTAGAAGAQATPAAVAGSPSESPPSASDSDRWMDGKSSRPLNTGDAEQAGAVSLLECVTTQNEYNMM